MTPPINDIVEYRSMSGDLWEAIVIADHGNDIFDLDVIIPGCQDHLRVTEIPRGELGRTWRPKSP